MKNQDMLTLGHLLAHQGQALTFQGMSTSTGLSVGELHASQKRLVLSGLVKAGTRQPLPLAVRDFLIYGLRYVFPAQFSGRTQGMATVTGAAPLAQRFSPGEDLVWPDEEGKDEGPGLTPLHPRVPRACAQDPALYEWMALCDALRAGRARERKMAIDEVSQRLGVSA